MGGSDPTPDKGPFQFAAETVLDEFDRFYQQFLDVPGNAKRAFEQRNHKESLRLSARRLQLYRESIDRLEPEIKSLFPDVAASEANWDEVEVAYRARVRGRYGADLPLAYFHSVRRRIYRGQWRTEDYSEYQAVSDNTENRDAYIRIFPVTGQLTPELVRELFTVESFDVPYQDLALDADLICSRAISSLRLDHGSQNQLLCIEMIVGGFYRNRGAYIVGRARFENGRLRPFIIALLNEGNGIYADALITSSTYAHNMFSSTLANFHVTSTYYHEICQFLASIMPMRPLGLHYSTIGYNHLGKVAVMNEMEGEISQSEDKLTDAVGAEGTVAIGFSSPDCSYVLKVIRNEPTRHYKWGDYEGLDSVLQKYYRVHDINRSDSMMDAIIYTNLSIDRTWFEQEFVDKLLEFASNTVVEDGDYLVFSYLIVQRKLTPLPVYLETATEHQAETVIRNLGYCIKNNAAANIFNKDLDARNYGVSSYAKVYLYDYDALEIMTDVKVHTNTDRFDGEEDIPEWYFEEGYVFLPEEIIVGLCLPYRNLRRLFADSHPELLTVEYWENIQQQLSEGVVLPVSVYPDSVKLDHDA